MYRRTHTENDFIRVLHFAVAPVQKGQTNCRIIGKRNMIYNVAGLSYNHAQKERVADKKRFVRKINLIV